jgi:hypothetical protein
MSSRFFKACFRSEAWETHTTIRVFSVPDRFLVHSKAGRRAAAARDRIGGLLPGRNFADGLASGRAGAIPPGRLRGIERWLARDGLAFGQRTDADLVRLPSIAAHGGGLQGRQASRRDGTRCRVSSCTAEADMNPPVGETPRAGVEAKALRRQSAEPRKVSPFCRDNDAV